MENKEKFEKSVLIVLENELKKFKESLENEENKSSEE